MDRERCIENNIRFNLGLPRLELQHLLLGKTLELALQLGVDLGQLSTRRFP